MRRLTRGAAVLLLVAATPAAATVRALLVGINQYRFSVDHDPTADPKFHDLKGAVNDVETMRRALVAHGVAVAPLAAGCRAVSPAGTVLTDACARRADIVAAWATLAAASARGDTLLMYYSGHGSTMIDTTFTQDGGKSDTIVPSDARGRAQNPEIVDIELKALIDAATARGVNVVTIFDSCNSRTATRSFGDDLPRAIPPGPPRRLPAVAAAPTAANPGYRIHLSAAADDQVAVERGGHGLFTGALIAALAAHPQATYGDLIAAVRQTLAKETQTPGAEGALNARFLGPPPPPGRFFTGRVAGGAVVVKFGTLSLVTPGSRFAIFASATAATTPGANPLATGTVTAADPHQARIVPAGRLPIASSDVVVAELAHDYGTGTIGIALTGTPAQQAMLTAALAPPLPVKLTATGPAFVVRWAGGAPQLVTTTPDATVVYDGTGKSSSELIAGLQREVRSIADYQALLALQVAAGPPQAQLHFLTGTCSADTEQIAPAKVVAGEPTFAAGEDSHVMVANTSGRPLYSYLFGLNHDYHVVSLNPAGADILIAPKPGPSWCHDLLLTPGRAILFAVLSDTPLDAAALAQNGETGARSFGGCAPGTLAYLVCKARLHTRGFGPAAPAWTVAMSTTNVVSGGSSP